MGAGDSELRTWIENKERELFDLMMNGGLSPKEIKLIEKDLDRLHKDSLTLSKKGYNMGGVVAVKSKYADLKKKINDTI